MVLSVHSLSNWHPNPPMGILHRPSDLRRRPIPMTSMTRVLQNPFARSITPAAPNPRSSFPSCRSQHRAHVPDAMPREESVPCWHSPCFSLGQLLPTLPASCAAVRSILSAIVPVLSRTPRPAVRACVICPSTLRAGGRPPARNAASAATAAPARRSPGRTAPTNPASSAPAASDSHLPQGSRCRRS